MRDFSVVADFFVKTGFACGALTAFSLGLRGGSRATRLTGTGAKLKAAFIDEEAFQLASRAGDRVRGALAGVRAAVADVVTISDITTGQKIFFMYSLTSLFCDDRKILDESTSEKTPHVLRKFLRSVGA